MGFVAFWANFPQQAVNESYQNIQFFDCGDSISASINGTSYKMDLTYNLTTIGGIVDNSSGVSKGQMNQVTTELQKLQMWNHFAFSFGKQKMNVFLNGIKIQEKSIQNAFINTQADLCTIGNSRNQKNPSTIQIRHLIFSQISFDNNQTSMQEKLRSEVIPYDQNVLAYFKFQKDFGIHETYFFNSSRNYLQKNVTSEKYNEYEKVCYCTGMPQSYLQITSNITILPLSLDQSVRDQQNLQIEFQIFPLKLDGNTSNLLILSLPGYTDIYLVNKLQSIRVDLYSSANSKIVQKTIVFPNYRFRMQLWTIYSISITNTTATLTIDGYQTDFTNISVFLPQMPKKLQIQNPYGLQYLLNYVIVSDQDGRIYLNQTFNQQSIMPGFQQYNISRGILHFETNNRLCVPSDIINPSLFIDSSGNCKDARVFAMFQNYNSTLLSAILNSSLSTMTYEFWMKDMKIRNQQDVTSVILENQQGSIVNGQIALITNSSNIDQIFLRVTPQLNLQSSYIQWSTFNTTYNHWLHISIISNASYLQIICFNNTNKQKESIVLNNLSFTNSNISLLTSLGASISGLNKFQGFLRELRIWQVARSDQEIGLLRQSSYLNPSSKLLHYFRINSGNELYQLYDAKAGQNIIENSQNIASIEWIADRDLITCRTDTFFNGACCQAIDLTGIDFMLKYSLSKSQISGAIINTTNSSLVANFSLISIGYEFDNSTKSFIKSLFELNSITTFNISASYLNPLVYNITVRARIYSLLGNNVIEINKTLTLQCPQYVIQVNNNSLYSSSNYLALASTSPSAYLKLQLRSIQNTTQCYNPLTLQIYNVSQNQIVWSQNLSIPNIALKFQSIWNTSSDNSSLIFKQVAITGQLWNMVYARVYFNSSNYIEVGVNLTYSNLTLVNSNFPLSGTFTRNYLQSQQIIIDLQNTTTSNPKVFPNITYDVTCPSGLFLNTSQQQCLMNGGVLRLNTSQLSIQLSQKYTFTFVMGIQNTNVMSIMQGTLTFYQDGTTLTVCPQIVLAASYQYDKTVNNTTVIIQPNPILYCNGTFFEARSVIWTATDQLSKKQILNLFTSPQNSLIPILLVTNNTAVQGLLGGTTVKMQGVYTVVAMNQTQQTLPVKQTLITVTSAVNVKKNPLVPQIIVTSFNKVTLDTVNILFLEPNITLNASSSYDPDNLNSQFNYQWTCPPIINSTLCRSIQTGTRNSSILIPLWMKFQLGFQYNVNYNFSMKLSSIDNVFAINSTLLFNISFAYPQKTDILNSDMSNTNCEVLTASSPSFYISSSTDNTLEYTINDWNSHSISITAIIDQNSNLPKSPCAATNVELEFIYFYIFDGLVSQQQALNQLLSQTQQPILKYVTRTIQTSDYPNLQTVKVNTQIQTNLYIITKRIGSSKLYISIQKIFFKRMYSPVSIDVNKRFQLIAVLNPPVQSIDQYAAFYLDASASYDSDNGQNINLTYQWQCPTSLNIKNCQTSGPILTITSNDRIAMSVNQVDSTTPYSVTVLQGTRMSLQATSLVAITAQDDYSSCLIITDQISLTPLTYDFQGSNRTIFIDQNQSIALTYSITLQTQCNTASIYNYSWKNQDPQGLTFWTIDPQNSLMVQINSASLHQQNPGTVNVLMLNVNLQLGKDSKQLYAISWYIQFVINLPPLMINIPSNQIVIPNISSLLLFQAQQIVDPLNQQYQCTWDCPTDLGGLNCSNNCLFNQSYSDLQQLALSSQNQSLSYLYDSSLEFNVTITSIDSVRSVKTSTFIYMIDQTQSSDPFSQIGIQDCSIQMYQQYTPILVSQLNVFYFSCKMNNLTNYIQKNYILLWNVSGLTPFTDYYNASGQLFIKPYAFAKLSTSSIVVSLTIIPSNPILPMRLLQQIDSLPIDPNTSSTDNKTAQSFDNSTNQTSLNNNDITNSSSDSSIQSTNQTLSNLSASILREFPDRSIKAYFQIQRDLLQFGNVQISATSNLISTYVTNVTFSFSGFSASPQSTVLFQLRGNQNLLYNSSQILIPLKLFSQNALDQFYTQTYLPVASEIWLDFFDGNLNYLGSINTQGQDGPLSQINQLGSLSFNQFNSQMSSIYQKSFLGYQSGSTNDFDKDMKRMLELTELFILGGVQNMYSGLVNGISSTIISYLKFNFQSVLAQYQGNDFYQNRQMLIIQKRAILIIYNLLQFSPNIQSSVLQILNVFALATNNIEQLLYSSGEDSQALMTIITNVGSQLQVQLQSLNLTNQASYYNKINNISNSVSQAFVQNNFQGRLKVSQITTQLESRTIYKLNFDSNTTISVENANNRNESFSFSGTEDSLNRMNVNILLIQYNQASNSSNLSAQSLLTISGLDGSGSAVNVSFPQDSNNYFQMSFQTRSDVIAILLSQNASKPLYQIKCVYYDTFYNGWLSTGVLVDSYNQTTGIINCRSYHLTQFSVMLVPINYSLPNTNNITNQSSGQNTTKNNTVTPVNEVIISSFITFYNYLQGNYIAAVVLIVGLTLILTIVPFIFCRYKHLNANNNLSDICSQEVPESSAYVRIISVMKVYHPVISCLVAQQNPTLAIPRVYNVLSLMIYVYTICLSSLIHIVCIASSQADYVSRPNIVVSYSVIYLAVLWVLRPLFNMFKYHMYLKYSCIKLSAAANQEYIQRPQNPKQHGTSQRASLYKAGPEDKGGVDEFEGGDSEDEDVDLSSNGDIDLATERNQNKFNILPAVSPRIMRGSQYTNELYNRKESDTNSALQFATQDEEIKEHSQIHRTKGASHDNNNEFDPIKHNDILINIGRDSTTEGQNYNTNKPLQDNINVGVVQNNVQQALCFDIENDHNLKGTRIILLIIFTAIVIGEMIAILIIMKKVDNGDVLSAWIKTCIAMIIIYSLCIDTILAFIFSLIIGRQKHQIKKTGFDILSAILVGNPDYRAKLSCSLEIKGRSL